MGKNLAGFCPDCGRRLEYEAGEESVFCYVCEAAKSVASLTGSSASKPSAATATAISAAAITGFDNPESGVVFIENFFETYNWTEYKETDELPVKEIAEVVANNKIKNGAVGQSWYLDFKALSVPVAKKFEGMADKAKAIADEYNPYDTAASYQEFDVYRKINNMLVDSREDIIKQLETAVKYADKFKLEAAKITEMNKELKAVKTKLAALGKVENISEVPEFIEARNAFDKKKEKEFAEQGIDAKSVYAEAVALFNAGSKTQALSLFESVRGYAESVQYILKINEYFSYDEMFHFFGKYFIYKKESFTMPTLAIGKLGKKKKNKAEAEDKEEQENTVMALSLYEVVNGVPADKPVLKGIEQFVTCYNNKYYYFKKNQGLWAYDFASQAETCVVEGKTEDFYENGAFQVLSVLNGTNIALKKKLKPIEKKGCAKIFKKKKAEEFMVNNYSLVLVELKTNTSKVVIPEMVDIAERYDKQMFYIHAENLGKAKHKKGEPEMIKYKSVLKACDLETGENTDVLNEGCEIHNVVDKKIVYSLWKPNALNRDLRVFDMATKEDILIEDNIYDYFDVIEGKIYYTIGNIEYQPLMRKNLDGTDRKEIMQDIERIIGVRAGWLYVKKGYGKNALLVKVSADGETRMIVCTQFKEIVAFSASHVHYVDTSNNFRVVRSDGKENRVIGENIEKAIVVDDDKKTYAIIDDKYMYYVRSEKVENDEYAYSLYRMDADGHNVRKLVFNVETVSAYDKEKLFYVKAEDVRFKVTVPVSKKKNEEHYENHFVTRYFEFEKETEKSKVVLTLGLPHGKSSFKKGCLSKKSVSADIVYEEAPVERSFKRKGLAKVGAVEHAEQEKKAQEKAEAKAEAKNGGSKSGCNGILNSIKKIGKGKKKGCLGKRK